jgi:hypothetical protein
MVPAGALQQLPSHAVQPPDAGVGERVERSRRHIEIELGAARTFVLHRDSNRFTTGFREDKN